MSGAIWKALVVVVFASLLAGCASPPTVGDADAPPSGNAVGPVAASDATETATAVLNVEGMT